MGLVDRRKYGPIGCFHLDADPGTAHEQKFGISGVIRPWQQWQASRTTPGPGVAEVLRSLQTGPAVSLRRRFLGILSASKRGISAFGARKKLQYSVASSARWEVQPSGRLDELHAGMASIFY